MQPRVKHKEFVVLLAIQCGFVLALRVTGQEHGILIVAGAISLLCVAQGILSMQGGPDARRNILFPGFLIRRRLPTALLLLCLAVLPFLYCMSTGKRSTVCTMRLSHTTICSALSETASAL